MLLIKAHGDLKDTISGKRHSSISCSVHDQEFPVKSNSSFLYDNSGSSCCNACQHQKVVHWTQYLIQFLLFGVKDRIFSTSFNLLVWLSLSYLQHLEQLHDLVPRLPCAHGLKNCLCRLGVNGQAVCQHQVEQLQYNITLPNRLESCDHGAVGGDIGVQVAVGL